MGEFRLDELQAPWTVYNPEVDKNREFVFDTLPTFWHNREYRHYNNVYNLAHFYNNI